MTVCLKDDGWFSISLRVLRRLKMWLTRGKEEGPCTNRVARNDIDRCT